MSMIMEYTSCHYHQLQLKYCNLHWRRYYWDDTLSRGDDTKKQMVQQESFIYLRAYTASDNAVREFRVWHEISQLGHVIRKRVKQHAHLDLFY